MHNPPALSLSRAASSRCLAWMALSVSSNKAGFATRPTLTRAQAVSNKSTALSGKKRPVI